MAGTKARARRAAPRGVVLWALLVATVGLPALPAVGLAADGRAEDDLRIDEANRLFLGGRYEDAERWLAALVAEHPDDASLQRKLGLCYYYLRRPEPALTHLRAYLARDAGISAQDREDVERWIREMEGLLEPVVEPVGQARAFPPPASASLSAPTPSPPVVLTAASAVPALRRGFLLVPYGGWQFPLRGPDWMKSAFRFGSLIGGHLSRNFSLSGEPAFSTWSFLGNHHAAQIDASITLLGHISGSRTEFVVGPRLGWSMVLRNNFDEHTYPFVNGVQYGGKAALFMAMSDQSGLGIVLDVAFTRSYESDSRCFESNGVGELDCNQTNNTAFGALSGALLF